MGMYKPDHRIVRKLKQYDPHLFVEWNNKKKWWEVFYDSPTGRKLITPVTKSIYQRGGAIEFAPLDDRIVAWLYYADSQKSGSAKDHWDKYWNSEVKNEMTQAKARKQFARDLSKNAWFFHASHYVKKHQAKNDKKINHKNNSVRHWSLYHLNL